MTVITKERREKLAVAVVSTSFTIPEYWFYARSAPQLRMTEDFTCCVIDIT